MNDFLSFAVSNGMNSAHVEHAMASSMQSFTPMARSAGYINPSILEERKLNVTQMDVFSRLMMDRIIFLGTEINDYTANVIQAQLLYLDSVDSDKPISIYLNTPGGSVYAGLGILIPCSLSRVLFLLSVRAWRPLWERSCWRQVRRASVPLCHIAA